MKGDPNLVKATTRAALPLHERRDAWLEQRLTYLAGEQARLEAGAPLEALFAGRLAAYRRFLLTADPAHRFHGWATIQAVEPRGWTNSNAGERVMKSPDRHRTARSLSRHWRRA